MKAGLAERALPATQRVEQVGEGAAAEGHAAAERTPVAEPAERRAAAEREGHATDHEDVDDVRHGTATAHVLEIGPAEIAFVVEDDSALADQFRILFVVFEPEPVVDHLVHGTHRLDLGARLFEGVLVVQHLCGDRELIVLLAQQVAQSSEPNDFVAGGADRRNLDTGRNLVTTEIGDVDRRQTLQHIGQSDAEDGIAGIFRLRGLCHGTNPCWRFRMQLVLRPTLCNKV